MSCESIIIPIMCPVCGADLIKTRYTSKSNWVSTVRIYCRTDKCVDTGKCSTLSDAYETLLVYYYGAKPTINFRRSKNEKV
jgi:hypothetical protein